MEQEYAIELSNVKKKFKIYYDKGKMLKERVLFHSRNRYETRWVLKGIDFKVKRGEAIGLIGHNGCGKSTTLKLLTRIMYPDEGTIKMNGRVSSLIELGAGFHPDMSGRENIYINASIFGLTRKEIENRIDDIIAFSELEKFIDNPVRTYSSGMYMRLAFSVAINVDADILLIDEILAVGDVNFQNKCFNKLMEIKQNGTTIVLVSHSTAQIEQICDRSIWIHEGLIKAEGNTKEVNQQYLFFMDEQRKEAVEAAMDDKEEKKDESTKESDKERVGTGEARFTQIIPMSIDRKKKYTFKIGDDLVFEMNYHVNKPIKQVYFGMSIFRNDGIRCYGSNTNNDHGLKYDLDKDGKMYITFPNIQLMPGKYFVDTCIEISIDNYSDYYNNAVEFEVIDAVKDIGICRMEHEWVKE